MNSLYLNYLNKVIAVMVIFILGVLLPRVVKAQTEVSRRVPAAKMGTVSIENLSGSVIIHGWDQPAVEVSGTLGRAVKDLVVENQRDRVEIVVELPRRSRRGAEAQLEIHLPRRSTVEVEGVSVQVAVNDVTGMLDLETVNGNITVEGTPSEVHVETVSGDVEIRGNSKHVHVETVSGGVDLEQTDGGAIEVNTVSGEIWTDAQNLHRGNFEVVSGRLHFTGTVAPDGVIQAQSHSGSTELTLSPSDSVRFDIKTYSGQIGNELGPPAKRTGRFTPQKELHFALGQGEGRIEVESFSGHISIKAK